MTTALPPLATFNELLRSTVRTSMNAVTEGSRRNARDAISARATDAESAGQLLAALAPTNPAAAPITQVRSA
jgi:hypothetical protein